MTPDTRGGTRRRPTTIGRSFLVWILGVMLMVLVVVSALVLWHEKQILEDELRQRSEIVGRALAIAVAGEGTPGFLAVVPLEDLRAGEVRASDGRVLWSYGPPLDEAAELEPNVIRVVVDHALPSHGPSQPARQVDVELLVSRTHLDANLAMAAIRLVLGLGFALPLAMLLGMALVGRIVGPLSRLSDWVGSFRADDLTSPPDLSRAPAEVQALGEVFGSMARRLHAQRMALSESEQRYRSLFSASPTPLLDLDDQGRIVGANPAAEPFLGGPAENATGRELAEWLEGEDLVLQEVGSASATHGEAVVESHWRMTDGSMTEVELHLRPTVSDESGGGTLVAIWDLTDRLRRDGERWRRTFDALPEGVGLIDDEGRVVHANLTLENHLAVLAPLLRQQPVSTGSGSWLAVSRGRRLECVLSAPPGLEHRVLVVRDVTEALEAEARQRESAKLQAVGTLASGVAHDFNNLLAAILLHARLLEKEPVEAGGEAVAAIRRLAEEGSDVVRELLLYASRESTPPRALDLAALVRDQEPILRHVLPPEVTLAVETPDEPVAVVGSPVGLRRMVLNLVVNARDAVADRKGSIRLRVTEDDHRARLEVEDDGPGIPPDLRERIFEPFFSLRRKGRGAGLGLAVVHAVVTDHGGRLEVESPDGGGTRVVVRLPSCAAADVPPPEGEGGRRVLVVGSGRESAPIMETLATAGFDLRHVLDGAAARTVVLEWRPEVTVVAGEMSDTERSATSAIVGRWGAAVVHEPSSAPTRDLLTRVRGALVGGRGRLTPGADESGHETHEDGRMT